MNPAKWAKRAADSYKKWRQNARIKEAIVEFEKEKVEVERNYTGRRAARPIQWNLPEGFLWNPLIGYPRNKGCFCGSGGKAKQCCLPFQPRALPEDSVLLLKKHWANLLKGEVTLPPAPGAKPKALRSLSATKQNMIDEFFEKKTAAESL